MRTNFTQLPTADELRNIFTRESVRQVSPEKESIHYPTFESIIALLRAYDIPLDFFIKSYTLNEILNESMFSEVTNIFDSLLHKILESQNDIEYRSLFNAIYDYLSEEDLLENGDMIFVFGSQSTLRIQKAIELYKKGCAPQILISGGHASYKVATTTPEALVLKEYAIEQGVPEKDIITETKSITVPDNVKCSMNMLEKQGIPYTKIILVNSPFSQRRGWCHFRKWTGDTIKLIRVNANVSKKFSKDYWYHNEDGTRIILKEFFGLRVSMISNTA